MIMNTFLELTIKLEVNPQEENNNSETRGKGVKSLNDAQKEVAQVDYIQKNNNKNVFSLEI